MNARRRGFFEGWYYKQQTGGQTLALIPGRSGDGAFIQILTAHGSWNVPYDLRDYRRDGQQIRIGGNEFSPDGIRLSTPYLSGELHFDRLTPIRGDIMGPFRFLPMECRHGIISMRHAVTGSLSMKGKTLCFDGGTGYIETDSGRSFPKDYTWIQCNDFKQNVSIMASIAHIPFAGLSFWGCIAVVWIDGREYRLATYRGVKIVFRAQNRLVLKQGELCLDVEPVSQAGHALYAPKQGAMSRTIHECAACPARFRFTQGRTLLFAGEGLTSYEHVTRNQ